jgi:hypothetical protein
MLLLLFGGLLDPVLYWVVYPSSLADPTATDIIAGWPGSATVAAHKLAPVMAGAYPSPTTNGLTSGVSYKVAFVWTDGTYVSNVAISAPYVYYRVDVSWLQVAPTTSIPALTLANGVYTFKIGATSSDMKVYVTTNGSWQAKLTPNIGDKLIILTAGGLSAS